MTDPFDPSSPTPDLLPEAEVATADPAGQAAPPTTSEFPPGGRTPATTRRRWPRVVWGLVVLLVVLLLFAGNYHLNEYAISPGTAQNVAPLITVPPSKAHPLTGTILLTDVDISTNPITLLQWIPYKLDSNTVLVGPDQVLDPGTSSDQLAAQGFLEMQQAQDAARAAALTRLGYTVTQHAAGVQIQAVQTGSPAAHSLAVGDVVTAVNGTATPDLCSFIRQLHPLEPGQAARLTVRPVTYSNQGTPQYGAATAVVLRTVPAPKKQLPSGCPGVVGPSKSYIGVFAQTNVVFGFPFHVGLSSDGIGGPSAGLAMTLGIIDRLSSGRLAHGVVAATGTMDPQQQVGDVGGVPQKTVAVERGGATLFMVPPGEYHDALSKATANLRVCKVSTLGQALGDLKHFGGHVAPSLHPAPFNPVFCN